MIERRSHSSVTLGFRAGSHHHVHWNVHAMQGMVGTPRQTVGGLGLVRHDDIQVEIAVVVRFPPCIRTEQNHPDRASAATIRSVTSLILPSLVGFIMQPSEKTAS